MRNVHPERGSNIDESERVGFARMGVNTALVFSHPTRERESKDTSLGWGCQLDRREPPSRAGGGQLCQKRSKHMMVKDPSMSRHRERNSCCCSSGVSTSLGRRFAPRALMPSSRSTCSPKVLSPRDGPPPCHGNDPSLHPIRCTHISPSRCLPRASPPGESLRDGVVSLAISPRPHC